MHLKLGLMKNYVKTMNQEETAFTYLREKFPRLSEAKFKEGIFIGPQIRGLFKDEYFDKLLQGDEKAVWDSFKFVVKGFLGNKRARKDEELVINFLKSYIIHIHIALCYFMCILWLQGRVFLLLFLFV
jgi:hypothetical protein